MAGSITYQFGLQLGGSGSQIRAGCLIPGGSLSHFAGMAAEYHGRTIEPGQVFPSDTLVMHGIEQARLIVLDLHDQVIAGLAGDLEGFFGNAWRRA